MTLQTTSQHGVPFDPAAAREARERAARKQAFSTDARSGFTQAQEEPEARLNGTPRQHGRYLDQMESAWKERARDRGRDS